MYFDEIQYPEHSDFHDFLLEFTFFTSRQIQNIFQNDLFCKFPRDIMPLYEQVVHFLFADCLKSIPPDPTGSVGQVY